GEVTKNSIQLGWTKVNDSNFSNYKLYRSIINNVDENSTLVTIINNSDQNTFTDEGLNSATVYYYKVYVYSTNGIGSPSNEVSATTNRDISAWVSTKTIPSLREGITKNSMHIISDNDIWIAGNREIWHYDGSNWSLNFSLDITTDEIYAITFINSNKGWAVSGVGGSSTLYEYNGIIWSKVENISLPYVSYDIAAFNNGNILIVGSEGFGHEPIAQFNKSVWSTSSIQSILFDLDVISENNIWALGKEGNVFNFNGVGWALTDQINKGEVSSISALSSNDIWVTTLTDGTNSSSASGLWHFNGSKFDGRYKLPENKYYQARYSIEMISAQEGWSSLYNFPYSFSYFDGNNWQDISNPVNSSVRCIKFLSRDNGWAITEDGTILRYLE
ncbi:MAG: fibronectin type III domain-containing protein, partial [Melioribacteraceae bacterium]